MIFSRLIDYSVANNAFCNLEDLDVQVGKAFFNPGQDLAWAWTHGGFESTRRGGVLWGAKVCPVKSVRHGYVIVEGVKGQQIRSLRRMPGSKPGRRMARTCFRYGRDRMEAYEEAFGIGWIWSTSFLYDSLECLVPVMDGRIRGESLRLFNGRDSRSFIREAVEDRLQETIGRWPRRNWTPSTAKVLICQRKKT